MVDIYSTYTEASDRTLIIQNRRGIIDVPIRLTSIIGVHNYIVLCKIMLHLDSIITKFHIRASELNYDDVMIHELLHIGIDLFWKGIHAQADFFNRFDILEIDREICK